MLTTITIPDSVTSIGNYAFYGCNSLYLVYNNSNISLEINTSDNGYAASYAKILVQNGVTTYKNEGIVYTYLLTDDNLLFRYCYDGTKPSGKRYELIAYCGDKDTVTLPVDINGEEYTIYRMRGVVNVIIPEGFTNISGAFFGCDTLTSIILPNGITNIGDAFSGCSKLESITIPDSVTNISNQAFYRCTSLTSVTFGENSALTSIGHSAFLQCTSLTNITLPNSVSEIAAEAFENCPNLTSIVITSNVTSIGWRTFYRCSNLTTVYYTGNAEEWNNISIGTENSPLIDATRYYYSETMPTEEGNFWHYDENGEIAVW